MIGTRIKKLFGGKIETKIEKCQGFIPRETCVGQKKGGEGGGKRGKGRRWIQKARDKKQLKQC
jgi:hypothetical protein